MATLAEQRRAIGDSIAKARQVDLAKERQDIRKSVHKDRTGKEYVENLNSLVTQPRQRRTLKTLQPAGALPVSRGRGEYKPPPAVAGGGIASPLIEVTAAGGVPVREYWPAGLKSSDGLFILPALKVLNLQDANGAPVKIELANPEGGA